jgi:hypothetical protein
MDTLETNKQKNAATFRELEIEFDEFRKAMTELKAPKFALYFKINLIMLLFISYANPHLSDISMILIIAYYSKNSFPHLLTKKNQK